MEIFSAIVVPVCLRVYVGGVGATAMDDRYSVGTHISTSPQTTLMKALRASVLEHLQSPHCLKSIQNLVEQRVNLLTVYEELLELKR